MTRDEQVAVYEQAARAAVGRLVAMLETRTDEIIALGRERAFGGLGDEYGDVSYGLGDDALDGEAMQELADAVFYVHVPVARGGGLLPAGSDSAPLTPVVGRSARLDP